MELDIKETGKYIRQYRKIAGLTQEELAQKVGVSTMSIRRYESGERVATRELIEAIATVLGVDPYSLYTWEQATESLEEHINAQVPRERVDAAVNRLNDAGMEKAADVVEIIAEVPRYRREGSPEPGTPTRDIPTPQTRQRGRSRAN